MKLLIYFKAHGLGNNTIHQTILANFIFCRSLFAKIFSLYKKKHTLGLLVAFIYKQLADSLKSFVFNLNHGITHVLCCIHYLPFHVLIHFLQRFNKGMY